MCDDLAKVMGIESNVSKTPTKRRSGGAMTPGSVSVNKTGALTAGVRPIRQAQDGYKESATDLMLPPIMVMKDVIRVATMRSLAVSVVR